MGRALVPFYKSAVPDRLKKIVPPMLRELVKRRLDLKLCPEGDYDNPITRKRVRQALEASREGDWPQAVEAWQGVLDVCASDEALLGIARMHLSIARRLENIDEYKAQVRRYISGRITRTINITVYTAIVNDCDSPKMPELLDPRINYVLFTDRPILDSGVWEIHPITYFHQDPTRMARFVKTHPHVLLGGCDIAVWVDSNIMIMRDIYPLVEQFMNSGKAVGAVPHPFRTSVYEEIEACIRERKDDAEVMREQIKEYRNEGFEHADLIESGLMMFDLRDERLKSFLNAWWAQIDSYSRRDQLSLNYALAMADVQWHRLMERPKSVRNHPAFAYVPHDDGRGPARKLFEALGACAADPYSGLRYADIREERIAAQRNRSIDIVVCVHNAWKDVKQCLESIRSERTSENQRLIIVDDGSEHPTAGYLQEFAATASWVELYRNKHAQGYTKAANRGLAVSTGEMVVLLNSDTLVTDSWVEKMADALFSTPGVGIVGPLSNAASHQSIPEHHSPKCKGQTAINELPPGMTAEDMNRCCEQWTVAHMLPRVPLVHGFCLGVRREVIDAIGVFDEQNFPKGYGEENDFCFRASDAGFGLVLATHTFVFHAKSRSYSDAERIALMEEGMQALTRLHGRGRVARAVESMQRNPVLVKIRRQAAGLSTRDSSCNSRSPRPRQMRARSLVALVPLQSTGQPVGSAYIRVIQPLQHRSLSRTVSLSVASDYKTVLASKRDALLVQRDAIASPQEAEALVCECRLRRVPLIFEIDDDLLCIPESHPSATHYSDLGRHAMRMLAEQADVVTVSTEKLRQRLLSLNDNVVVLPNALDESLWIPDMNPFKGRSDGEIRVLFMGTHSHDDDLALVMETIERLRDRYSRRFSFTLIGGLSGKSHVKPHVRRVRPDVLNYPGFARWMASSCDYDIAIAPLVDNDFNRCKSYIKYLDYGVCGLPTALSDVAPYQEVVRHGETGLLVDNTPEDWYDVLRALVDNPDLRRALGENARRDVLSHHTLASQSQQRRCIWSEILG